MYPTTSSPIHQLIAMRVGSTSWYYEYCCCVQVFAWTHVFISLREYSEVELRGHYCKFMLNFFRNSQTVLQSGLTTLHSYQQRMEVPVYPHSQVYF